MFSFFKKKEKISAITVTNFAPITVDMHSHVLPGIDDGAQTPADSIILIKKMLELGITKIIATPHIMADYYKNNAETINASLAILREALATENMTIDIAAAAEHYFDETFETLINNGQLMTMGQKYVLFELPFIGAPPNLLPQIKRMRDLGYKPILAHPERYTYLKLDDLKGIKNYGCKLQLNTISLTGYYGKQVKKAAEELAENGMVDFISSDMHHLRHADALEKALQVPMVQQLIDSKLLQNNVLL